MIKIPVYTPQTLAVKLTAVGERSLRSGHPWIFSESIEKINKDGVSGDVTIIFSHKKNKVIGVGLYDPDSPIRIKILHNRGGASLDSDFFSERIIKAYALRNELFETNTTAYRLLFGENDGFPGLIADVYAETLVVKLYSAIWFPYFETILKLLIEVSGCESVVLRLSRNVQRLKGHELKDGMIIYGELKDEDVQFKEHGIFFSANVVKGHKTGYFLDHRHNRHQVGKLSNGKSVLDIFSYSGGFSIHALAGGAKEVTSVDISNQALDNARSNAKLNKFEGEHFTIEGNAFDILKEMIDDERKFDIVVIDPPSFAKSHKEIAIAKKKYAELAQLGVQLTNRNGYLVFASCSSRVKPDDFFETIEMTLNDQKRNFSEVKRTGHDIDHPIIFNEGEYLKCGYYKIH